MEAGAMQTLYERLLPVFSKKQLMENVPMSRYTTLHLGGPALASVRTGRTRASRAPRFRRLGSWTCRSR